MNNKLRVYKALYGEIFEALVIRETPKGFKVLRQNGNNTVSYQEFWNRDIHYGVLHSHQRVFTSLTEAKDHAKAQLREAADYHRKQLEMLTEKALRLTEIGHEDKPS